VPLTTGIAAIVVLARQHRLSFLRLTRSRDWFSELRTFGGAFVTFTMVNTLSIIVARALLLRTVGAFEVGLYQAAWAFSTQVYFPLWAFLLTRELPRLSRVASDGEIQTSFVGLVKLGSLGAGAVGMVAAVTGGWLLPYLFSPAFAAAAPAVPIQIFGDFVRATSWLVQIVLLARGYLAPVVIIEALTAAAFVGASAFLAPAYGATGVAGAYLFARCIGTPLAYVFAEARTNFRLSRGAWRVLAASTLAVCVFSVVAAYQAWTHD
jgi:O-antigen/teichoic acid export membrane protein